MGRINEGQTELIYPYNQLAASFFYSVLEQREIYLWGAGIKKDTIGSR